MKKSLEEIIKELQSAQSVTNCPEHIQKLGKAWRNSFTSPLIMLISSLFSYYSRIIFVVHLKFLHIMFS